MGFDCSMYAMNISCKIIQLAGYADLNDELLEWYHELIDEALKEINVWNLEEMIRKCAEMIYLQLDEKKQALELAGLAAVRNR